LLIQEEKDNLTTKFASLTEENLQLLDINKSLSQQISSYD